MRGAGVRPCAVMTAPGEIGVETFEVPEPEPGAVVLRVRLSGVCGTDKHTFRGETIQYAGTPHERHLAYPLICGHENVGVVEAVGGGVRCVRRDGRLLRGRATGSSRRERAVRALLVLPQRPAVLPLRAPRGLRELLDVSRAPYLFGGWAEQMYLLPGTPLFRVPDELPDELAVLTEPMAVTHGVDAARRARRRGRRERRRVRRRAARALPPDEGAARSAAAA